MSKLDYLKRYGFGGADKKGGEKKTKKKRRRKKVKGRVNTVRIHDADEWIAPNAQAVEEKWENWERDGLDDDVTVVVDEKEVQKEKQAKRMREIKKKRVDLPAVSPFLRRKCEGRQADL